MTSDYCRSKRELKAHPRPPAGLRFYQVDSELHFDGFKAKYPGRAIFSFRPLRHAINSAGRILKNIRDEVRAPGLDGPKPSQRRGRLPTIERCGGVFVTQIRGGLSDCVVRSLHIDPKKHELSIEWKALFSEFFHDKVLTEAVIQANPVSTPHHSTVQVEKLTRSRILSQ